MSQGGSTKATMQIKLQPGKGNGALAENERQSTQANVQTEHELPSQAATQPKEATEKGKKTQGGDESKEENK